MRGGCDTLGYAKTKQKSRPFLLQSVSSSNPLSFMWAFVVTSSKLHCGDRCLTASEKKNQCRSISWIPLSSVNGGAALGLSPTMLYLLCASNITLRSQQCDHELRRSHTLLVDFVSTRCIAPFIASSHTSPSSWSESLSCLFFHYVSICFSFVFCLFFPLHNAALNSDKVFLV